MIFSKIKLEAKVFVFIGLIILAIFILYIVRLQSFHCPGPMDDQFINGVSKGTITEAADTFK